MSRIMAAIGSMAGFVIGGGIGAIAGYAYEHGRTDIPPFRREEFENESSIGFGVIGGIIGATVLAAAGAGCPDCKTTTGAVSGAPMPLRFP